MSMFKIEVTRIGYATRAIEVKAADQGEAERFAPETAGNYEFTEHEAEYQLAGRPRADPNGNFSSTQKGGALCPDRT